MSRSCPACYTNEFPEVSDITINQTTIEMDGAQVMWYVESFNTASPAFTAGANTIQLSHYPIHPSAVHLALNSGVQGQVASGAAANFSVDGNIVSLKFTPDDTDTIYVQYMAYTGDVSSDDEVVGMMKPWAAATAPSGWMLLDGTTSHTISDFPELYTFCTTNGLILSETATTFILKELKSVMQSAGAAVQVNTIIKT